MRCWNFSSSVNMKWKIEYGSSSSQQAGVPGLFCPQGIASKGIVPLPIGMLPARVGCPSMFPRGIPFLYHTGVQLLPLWASFQGHLAAGVVWGEGNLLAANPGSLGWKHFKETYLPIFLCFLCLLSVRAFNANSLLCVISFSISLLNISCIKTYMPLGIRDFGPFP